MRELTTIGSLRTLRAIERSSRLLPLRGMGWMGASNPNFVPPPSTDVAATQPGTPLANALQALLTKLTTSGVPPESTSDATVLAFQQAFNADPLSQAGGSNGQLDEDGGYGPNVMATVAALNGGSAPSVNAGATPAPVTPSTPTSPTTPATSTSSHALLWVLAIVAAVGVAYVAHRAMKKKRRRARALPSRAIVLT